MTHWHTSRANQLLSDVHRTHHQYQSNRNVVMPWSAVAASSEHLLQSQAAVVHCYSGQPSGQKPSQWDAKMAKSTRSTPFIPPRCRSVDYNKHCYPSPYSPHLHGRRIPDFRWICYRRFFESQTILYDSETALNSLTIQRWYQIADSGLVMQALGLQPLLSSNNSRQATGKNRGELAFTMDSH